MLLYHNYNIHILLHHNIIYYYDNDYIIIIVFAAYNLPNDRVDVTAKRSYFFPRFHILTVKYIPIHLFRLPYMTV